MHLRAACGAAWHDSARFSMARFSTIRHAESCHSRRAAAPAEQLSMPNPICSKTRLSYIQRGPARLPRATDDGNKDASAHHRAAILALWSSHCRAENRRYNADSCLPQCCCLLWPPRVRRAGGQQTRSGHARRGQDGARCAGHAVTRGNGHVAHQTERRAGYHGRVYIYTHGFFRRPTQTLPGRVTLEFDQGNMW